MCREIDDSSIRESSSDESPIFRTRLVDESGGMIDGGTAQLGSVGVTVAIRSCTSWRASSKSVPRSKMSVIEESCGTELERITSRCGTPLSWCSSGTVTNSSTSAAERPSVGVWISTRGGANSGKTSTRASRRSSVAPNTIRAAAASTTRNRNRRLAVTIQRITVGALLVLVVDPELRPVQLRRAHAHHRRAGGRAR